jgi:flagellar motor switch protein FliG
MAPPVEKQDENAPRQFSGRRRAAAFLLSLDSEASAAIISSMGEREVGLLTEEMSRIGDLTVSEMEETWTAFQEVAHSEVVSVEPMLEAILEKALGKERAKTMLEKIRRQSRDLAPFRSLRALDARQLNMILRDEHPQVLAIVMSYLEPKVSFEFLRGLEEEKRYDVIRRIATTEEMPTELVRQIDEILEVRAFTMAGQRVDDAGENRHKTVAQMLNIADPSISKNIIDRLTKELPEEADSIQALMFVFEDLGKVPDRDMQKVLGEVDKADLAMALKAAPDGVKNKILDNLSKRARDTIIDEIEMLGPKPLSEVEDAQKRILEVVRGMEERGDIIVQRGGGEEMV